MARRIEVAILTAVFIVIAGCFSISIVIYASGSRDTANSAIKRFKEQLGISECSQQVYKLLLVYSAYS